MDDTQLESRVAALEAWQQKKSAQQITFPLDIQSQKVLANYFMQITNIFTYEVVGAAAHVVQLLVGSQGLFSFEVQQQDIWLYTVNPANDTFNAPNTSFQNGQEVVVFTTATGSFPSPLVINTPYFIVNVSGTSFQLSATSGGSPINITNAGSDSQYIQLVLS